MTMLMNDFEEQLIKTFNDNPLPFEAKRYVALAVFNVIEAKYKEQLQVEKMKQEGKPDEQMSHKP